MEPVLRPGDRVLVRYGVPPRAGDLVLATLADGTLAVKRADSRRALRDGSPGWWLLSEDQEVGVDSRHRGPVPEAAVHGVVRARVWPRPRLFGRRRRPAEGAWKNRRHG